MTNIKNIFQQTRFNIEVQLKNTKRKKNYFINDLLILFKPQAEVNDSLSAKDQSVSKLIGTF